MPGKEIANQLLPGRIIIKTSQHRKIVADKGKDIREGKLAIQIGAAFFQPRGRRSPGITQVLDELMLDTLEGQITHGQIFPRSLAQPKPTGAFRSASTVERRDVEITLKQCREHPEMLVCLFEQRPYRINHVRPVGVDDQILGLDEVTGNMGIGDSLTRQLLKEIPRFVSVIDTINVDIVDVDQQVAISLCQHAINEIDLGHLLPWRAVVGRIFDRDASFEKVLDSSYAARNILDGIAREWNRHQVIQVPAVSAITQVVAVDNDFVLIEKSLQLQQILIIERVWSAKIQTQSVTNQWDTFGYFAKLPSRTAAHTDPVLRRDFPKANRLRGSVPGLQCRE